MIDLEGDDIRRLIAADRDRAPLPVEWSDVVARSARRAESRRRPVLAAAAAIVAIGLAGMIVVGVRDGGGDTADLPPAPTAADRSPETTVVTGTAADPLADLGDGDWVVPSPLPDGYRRLAASVGSPTGRRSQIFVHAGNERQIRLDVGERGSVPDDADEVLIGGVAWLRWTSSSTEGGDDGNVQLERTLDDRTVTLRTETANAVVLDEFARSLVVVPGDEIDFEYLDPDGFHTVVATIELDDGAATLGVQGIDGFFCWRIGYDGASGRTEARGACDNTTTPERPLATLGYLRVGDGTFVAVLADPSVDRFEVEAADGDIVSIEPRDELGQFDHGFWLGTGGVAGSLLGSDTVTVHFDDGSVVEVQAGPAGDWAVVGRESDSGSDDAEPEP